MNLVTLQPLILPFLKGVAVGRGIFKILRPRGLGHLLYPPAGGKEEFRPFLGRCGELPSLAHPKKRREVASTSRFPCFIGYGPPSFEARRGIFAR
ncbi:MAG: hypothetical protein A2849_02675 [Candidatus Taylorbacteria bacterium RIFCSPHIGHO2_01_FULL_51_15]|uniref:Uncharacterized protein n=1 Tax=Candidatus Taylorbacteria bacterium RIFCSPHIGHO2_01_FULL_51_15 TaxID=1802304 RepID=A0A1G2MFN0_9BACT|nr:MAG: hypothetical protein A2849_02675 [Candidatus Taylorbacteria bacterium RIFCSPHIGHO2_01_FULL_51_15]